MIAAPKRKFWTRVGVLEDDHGLRVALDDRPLRTPAKAELRLPSRPLAEAIAAEWDAQQDEIRPLTMPLTRAANVAIDKVTASHGAVAGMLAEYGGADLLCYRAEKPAALVRRQEEEWTPWLAWSARTLGAPLVCVQGVIHVDQPRESLERLAAEVAAHDAFELTALHDLVTLSGSLVLGLAVSRGALRAEDAWRLSRIDEAWQAEQWGEDDEAVAAAAEKRAAFLSAARLLALLRER